MSRIVRDGWAPRARAIGIDESTAVLFDSKGIARVIGKNSAFFLELNHAPETCESGKPLAVSGIEAYNLRANGDATFDLKSWKPIGAAKPYLISLRDGQMTETR
jgi:cyanophycinase